MRLPSHSAFSPAAALAFSLAATLLTSPAQASVVLDHGSPNRSSMYYADASYGYDSVAAGVKFTSPTGFSGIKWWGGYDGRITQTTSIDNFTLSIYASNGGAPGALLKTIALGAAQRSTGTQLMYGNALEYAYSASFNEIDLLAGSYFVGLTNADSDGGSVWGWETSSLASLGGYSRAAGGDWVNTGASLAFQLTQDATTVPEPSSLALAGLAFAGLAFARRRTRAQA